MQMIPILFQVKFSLVLCAYSLFELPNVETRLEILLNLWNKCDGYLVIIERGTRAGFNLIKEARDFLLEQIKKDDLAYVFAPVKKNYLYLPRKRFKLFILRFYSVHMMNRVHGKKIFRVILYRDICHYQSVTDTKAYRKEVKSIAM